MKERKSENPLIDLLKLELFDRWGDFDVISKIIFF